MLYTLPAKVLAVILTGIFTRALANHVTGEREAGSALIKRTRQSKTCSGLCRGGCDIQSFSRITAVLDQIISLNPPDYLLTEYNPVCKSPLGYPFHDTENNQISCYKFYPEMNCNSSCAVKRCGRNGAKLVSIETEDEFRHLKETIESNKDLKPINTIDRFGGYLTSGSDREEEGVWIWEATQQPLTYENWGYQYRVWEDPDVEDYLMFDTTSTSYKWWDAKDDRRAIVCEKQLSYI